MWLPALISGLISGIFVIILFLITKRFEVLKTTHVNDAGVEGAYIVGTRELMSQYKIDVAESRKSADESRQAASEAQHAVSEAQALAAAAQKVVSELQTLNMTTAARADRVQNDFDEFKRWAEGQIALLTEQVHKLQQENAGLIGGSIGLTHTYHTLLNDNEEI